MPGLSVDFFGDKEDLSNFFKLLDQKERLVYTEGLSKAGRDSVQFASAVEMMDYLVSYDQPVQKNIFVITKTSEELERHEVVMKDGTGKKISVDEGLNLDSAAILLGGEAAINTIVKTTLRTTGCTESARDLYKGLKKLLQKTSKRIGVYYVMPEAENKLNSGWRLTPGLGFSADLDLKV